MSDGTGPVVILGAGINGAGAGARTGAGRPVRDRRRHARPGLRRHGVFLSLDSWRVAIPGIRRVRPGPRIAGGTHAAAPPGAAIRASLEAVHSRFQSFWRAALFGGSILRVGPRSRGCGVGRLARRLAGAPPVCGCTTRTPAIPNCRRMRSFGPQGSKRCSLMRRYPWLCATTTHRSAFPNGSSSPCSTTPARRPSRRAVRSSCSLITGRS